MTQLQKRLIEKARKRHGKIFPVGGLPSFSSKNFQIIPVNGRKIACFWYDDEIQSTHVITKTIGGNHG